MEFWLRISEIKNQPGLENDLQKVGQIGRLAILLGLLLKIEISHKKLFLM